MLDHFTLTIAKNKRIEDQIMISAEIGIELISSNRITSIIDKVAMFD